MANRVRETHEKRRRQQAKLARRAAKETDRAERDAKKKADKLADVQPAPRYQTAAEMVAELEQQQQTPPPPKPKPPAVTPPPVAPKTP